MVQLTTNFTAPMVRAGQVIGPGKLKIMQPHGYEIPSWRQPWLPADKARPSLVPATGLGLTIGRWQMSTSEDRTYRDTWRAERLRINWITN